MSAESLSAIAGVVLSLVFSYVPGIKSWFENLMSEYKQAIMGILLVIVSVSIFGLSCVGIGSWIVCDKAGAMGLLTVMFYALVANQSVYLITKK